MMDNFKQLHPISQALIATIFTWGLTVLGSALVFLKRKFSHSSMDGMLGFTLLMVLDVAFG